MCRWHQPQMETGCMMPLALEMVDCRKGTVIASCFCYVELYHCLCGSCCFKGRGCALSSPPCALWSIPALGFVGAVCSQLTVLPPFPWTHLCLAPPSLLLVCCQFKGACCFVNDNKRWCGSSVLQKHQVTHHSQTTTTTYMYNSRSATTPCMTPPWP